jgi:acylphosphatase
MSDDATNAAERLPSMGDDLTRRFIRIGGRVQGVGFRYYVLRHANALGIKGFVRNTSDGSVEVDAEAPTEAMVKFISLLRTGPGTARVEQFHVSARPVTRKYVSFDIAPTAHSF